MLRKLYYKLPVAMRYWVRKVYYFPHDLLNRRAELVPPMGLIYTGNGDFENQGKDWVLFFKQYANLHEKSTFLDIGSGIGRIAIPLTSFLKGKYYGFDAVRQGIDWCNSKIATRYNNFHFLYVDLFNDLYKSKGIDAASFEFPYQDDQFDLGCAISVFTHMLPQEVENYLAEANRVLKKDGYLVATFFMLDDESRTLMQHHSAFCFKYDYEHYALMDDEVKSANVAYDFHYLTRTFAATGFSVAHYEKGYWCGRSKTSNINFQDIFVLKKIN
jgi:SAM-dependent methyltransferase